MPSHTACSARITRIVVAALLAAAVCIPVSHAQERTKNGGSPSVTVNYSDLNLATKEGSHVLYERLVDAARKVCPATGYALELRNNRDAQLCIDATVERAAKQINSPQFAQVAATRMR